MNARNLTPPALLSLSLALGACGGSSSPPGTPVASLADSGAGSLREAIASASAGATLRLTQGGTLSLASPLSIDKNVTIIATGVTLDAAGKGRALEVAPGATVTVQGGTMRGGVGQVLPAGLNAARVAGHVGPARLEARPALNVAQIGAQAVTPTYGGVIFNRGTLTLDGVTVTGGKANNGGGLYNAPGATLTLRGTTAVTVNTADLADPDSSTLYQGLGGGVFNAGTLTLAGGSVSGNATVYSGGGIFTERGSVTTITGGAVQDNRATYPITPENGVTTGSAGGGVYSLGDLTLTGGTISGNTASFFGGGVTVQSSTVQGAPVIPVVTLSGGTFENNRVMDDAGGGSGGAFWISGTLTMTGGTVKGNSAPYGGGIAMFRNASITGGIIEGNEARTKHGGGLLMYTPPARAAASAVTFGGSATVRGNRAGDHSGGILVDRTTFTMTGGTVADNTAVNTGGGLAFGGNTDSAIQGGVISGNRLTGTVDGGGGVRVFSSSKLTLAGGEISSNTTPRTGGGITVDGQLTMTGGSVTGNTVTDSAEHQGGGGIRLYAGAKVTVSGGTISGNKARWGAGVVVDGAYQTSPTSEFTLAGGTVSGNQVTDASNVGGGFFNMGKLTIASGSVTGNTATRIGGGVFNSNTAVFAQTGGSVMGNAPDNVFTAQ